METPFPTFEKLPGLMAWAKSFHQHAAVYMARLEADQLAKPMPLAWSAQVESAIGRVPEMTTIGDTVLQVALHSIHHRGQLNVRLRELGATPPLLDYIGWVWTAGLSQSGRRPSAIEDWGLATGSSSGQRALIRSSDDGCCGISGYPRESPGARGGA